MAADIMDHSEEKASLSTSILSTPVSAILIVSLNKKRGSAQYWQKFSPAMGLIDEFHEKCTQLQEIPGIMAIPKVKSKLSKKNTWITQVHGSMKAKKVLDMLKDKKDKKDQQAKSREEALKKKEDGKEAFLKCTLQCLSTT